MTILKYLEDTYLFEYKAKILDFWENDFWKYIILDETIFYPQWWWQPSDIWEIILDSSNIININNVRLLENWKVYHYTNDNIDWLKKVWCLIKINKENRILNAKNHSAGHLLDIAMINIWLWYLKATKWFHFPEWSNVEYEWKLKENKDIIIDKLNTELKNLIKESLKVNINLEKNVLSPIWKNPRYVNFWDYEWCWCWWTHVKSSAEIWTILVKKIKEKWNNLKVSYEVK